MKSSIKRPLMPWTTKRWARCIARACKLYVERPDDPLLGKKTAALQVEAIGSSKAPGVETRYLREVDAAVSAARQRAKRGSRNHHDS